LNHATKQDVAEQLSTDSDNQKKKTCDYITSTDPTETPLRTLFGPRDPHGKHKITLK